MKMGRDEFVSEPFHFSTTQGDMTDTPRIPQVRGIFWKNRYASLIS
jgi:hypothetical protein